MSTLISKGVFTSYDKERVEGRTTVNEKNEMMLDLIARKSQAAFDGFIDTLQDCDHEHVVHELVGPEVIAKLEAIVNAPPGAVVNEQRLEIQIRDAMQQSLSGENDVIKALAQKGISVSDVLNGSIIVKFRCRDYAALESLQELYSSEKLDQLFTKAFRPKFANKGLKCLRFSIADEEFQRCIDQKLMTSVHRKALLSSVEKLVDKMTVSDDLLNKLSLGNQHRQTVKKAGRRGQQVITLLDIISRQPDVAFKQLLEALDDTQQTEAAYYIRMCGSVKVKPSENVPKQESGTVIKIMFKLSQYCVRHIRLSVRHAVFTCVSYAEARNSYRLDVRRSVRLSVRHTLVLYQNG